MSKIDEYIAKRSRQSANFAKEYKAENQQLQVAVEVRNLRDKLGMTQREFAALVGKPQSTIARIESGKMNVSINVLNAIADATHQKLTVKFEPVSHNTKNDAKINTSF
jgi:transcriptional regulator with XRE-family HTH domain